MQYIINEKGKKLFAVVPIKEWDYLQMVKKKLELLNEGNKPSKEIEN